MRITKQTLYFTIRRAISMEIKVNVNNLNNQMTSQKKIQRPSRESGPLRCVSLRLPHNHFSEIDQYYENNIPDAESWMKVTETALANMKTILTDIPHTV